MRISDWSSDVCSSDLVDLGLDDRDQAVGRDAFRLGELLLRDRLDPRRIGQVDDAAHLGSEHALGDCARAQGVEEIGRSSCGERGCTSVSVSVVALELKKQNNETTTAASTSVDH